MKSASIPEDKPNDPQNFDMQAKLLAEVVKRILKKRADLDISAQPIFEIKPVTEFMKRMRVTALGKFEGTTYISTVTYFVNDEDMADDDPIGVLVLYIPEEYIVKLFQKLNYPIADEEDRVALEDACGTFCNLLAGNFKSGLTQLGYIELSMSHFSTYQNEIVNGVKFYPYQTQKYEIGFDIGGKKRIILDLVMGPLPRLFNPK